MYKIIKVQYNDDLYKDVLNLRYRVLREPLGLTIRDDEIEHDRNVLYFAYIKNDEIIGVVGLDFATPGAGKLMQMAVLEKYQGSGIGRELISALEEECKNRGLAEVFLDARFNAQRFYNRLGYEEYGGIYEKIGIPHILMRKMLTK